MKKLFFTYILLLFTFSVCMGQTEVTFSITHKLGNSPFDLDYPDTNDLGHSFDVTRLEYYVSEISIIHDGGTETKIADLYLLVDANRSAIATANLGNLPVTHVEAVRFHIGVDEANNHSNPVTWPFNHPLEPTSPSMHWGWASGYRFVAYEGNGGTELDQVFELHGLGDSNYFVTEVSLDATANNGAVSIDLDADYTRGLEGVALDNSIIVHGEEGEARTVIENFRDYVFTPSENAVSTVDISEVKSFDIFPNPSVGGKTNLAINASGNVEYEITVTDILAREIKHFHNVGSNAEIELDLDTRGIYFVNLIKDGQAVLNRKLVVQ